MSMRVTMANSPQALVVNPLVPLAAFASTVEISSRTSPRSMALPVMPSMLMASS